MPRGYRGVVFALVGWLILSAQAPSPKDNGEEAQASSDISRSLDAIARAQNQIAQATDTGEYEKPCNDGEANNKSDLCAQWYAARAAREAADWARWSLIVGLVGAAGIIVALLLTIDSNRIARDTARHQLRAYMALESFEVRFDLIENDTIVGGIISAVWKNAGQTPAIDLKDNISVAFMPQPLPVDFDFPDHASERTRGVSNVGPSQSVLTPSDRISVQKMDAVAGKSAHLYVWGWVEYRDIFRAAQRRTEFAHEVSMERTATGFLVSFSSLDAHNSLDEQCTAKRKRQERA